VTSVYIGGGTPTLALGSVASVLARVRERFRLTGDICIEANPADVDHVTVRRLHGAGVTLVSLGVQSFRPQNLARLGRRYEPSVAERGFTSVNADLMFALPGQMADELTATGAGRGERAHRQGDDCGADSGDAQGF